MFDTSLFEWAMVSVVILVSIVPIVRAPNCCLFSILSFRHAIILSFLTSPVHQLTNSQCVYGYYCSCGSYCFDLCSSVLSVVEPWLQKPENPPIKPLNHLSFLLLSSPTAKRQTIKQSNLSNHYRFCCYFESTLGPKARSPASPRPGTMYDFGVISSSIAPTHKVTLSALIFSFT